jgi:hypothetical protein
MEMLAKKPESSGKGVRPRGEPSSTGGSRGRSKGGTVVRWICAVVAVSVLPFLVLVRLSVLLYSGYGVWPWISVLCGAVAAAAVLSVFALIVTRVLTGSFRTPRYLKRVLVGLTVAYCGYSALYVSAANVKTDDVRTAYASLHPSLRVALSTWMLADPKLVITDAERTVEDYARMGLRPNERSLHLTTSSGYVHAVDLRTIGRPEWRNFVTTIYFKVMGFRVRRHIGTADHLHVSLPVHE